MTQKTKTLTPTEFAQVQGLLTELRDIMRNARLAMLAIGKITGHEPVIGQDLVPRLSVDL